MTDPKFFVRASEGVPSPSVAPGASGYFSAPERTLDPNLFNGDHLRLEVRQHILSTLVNWFSAWNWNDIGSWLHVWIAGSAITYQWAANRGNGDIDVLFGVDISKFRLANPGWDWPEDELAAEVNDGMKHGLWPAEAQVRFGSRDYEVTYFWNPGTGNDIRQIHPYAAYDVRNSTWAVPPPQLPEDPRTLYPQTWFRTTQQDKDMADKLVTAYNSHLDALKSYPANSPGWHNAGASLNLIVDQARALFDDIHTGRRAAFAEHGKGYGDYANFRWQRAKETGVVQALHTITSVGEEARKEQETAQFGQPIDASDVALRRAMMQYRNTP